MRPRIQEVKEAELPAAQGAVLARALDRLAERLPVMPGEEDQYFAHARRADALVGLWPRPASGVIQTRTGPPWWSTLPWRP